MTCCAGAGRDLVAAICWADCAHTIPESKKTTAAIPQKLFFIIERFLPIGLRNACACESE
jgi:hypothetical protein